MTKYIVCLSGKGGVGKTTSAINLAASLKFFGKEVAVVDGNLTTPNVSLQLGIHNPEITLSTLLQNKRNHISKATLLHQSGIHVIPASLALKDLKKAKLQNFNYLLDGLAGQYDYVILDAAAGLGKEALTTLEAADEVLIITNPELQAVVDALKSIQVAENLNKPIRGVLLTRAYHHKKELKVENIEHLLEYPVIGVIPEDIKVKDALFDKQPVVSLYPDSNAANSYKELAASLLGIDYQYYIKSNETFFDKLTKFFGFKK